MKGKIVYGLTFCWIAYILHGELQKLHFNYCSSSLLSIYFYSQSNYCLTLKMIISVIEERLEEFMKIDFFIKSLAEGIPQYLWRPSLISNIVVS